MSNATTADKSLAGWVDGARPGVRCCPNRAAPLTPHARAQPW